MRSASPAVFACFFACLLGGLGGCLAPSQSLLVEVRQQAIVHAHHTGKTEELVGAEGVGVKVTTLNPQHVFRVGDYTRWLGGGPEDDQPPAVTGPEGTLVILAPTDRPFMLNLMLPGAVPESLPFRETGVDGGTFAPTGWIGLPVGVTPAQYFVRVTPVGAEPGAAGQSAHVSP